MMCFSQMTSRTFEFLQRFSLIHFPSRCHSISSLPSTLTSIPFLLLLNSVANVHFLWNQFILWMKGYFPCISNSIFVRNNSKFFSKLSVNFKIYLARKNTCPFFLPIFVSVKKTDIYFFGNGSRKVEIDSSYGGKIKNWTFFLWKIQRSLLAFKKKTSINFFFFVENQRFLLAF